MRLLQTVLLAWALPFGAYAHYFTADDCQRFIDTYAPIAVEEMSRTGVPASITLAQAILESDWGRAPVALEANNFFGVKCYNDWGGPCVKSKDDEVGLSSFRKYEDVWQSFRDHSDFLKNSPRYEPLFRHHRTDYRKWTTSLRQLGYATDANYTTKLNSLIERFALNLYDHADQPAAPKVYPGQPKITAQPDVQQQPLQASPSTEAAANAAPAYTLQHHQRTRPSAAKPAVAASGQEARIRMVPSTSRRSNQRRGL